MGKIVDDFYVGFEPRLEKAEKKCVKWKLKMNQLGKIVNYVITQWSLKWVNTGNLWLARISQIVNTKPIVKEIGVTCPKCDKGQIIERRSNKRNVFSMGAVRIRNATLYLGISQLVVSVRSAKACL